MQSYFRNSLFIIAVIFSAISNAQTKQQGDDIIINALRDELDRNMKELKLPEFDKPFFMMYGLQDLRVGSITSTLGSLQHSSMNQQRFKTNTRILVGDYSFNDESLEDNLFSSPTAIEIGLPLEDDYLGIRRAFWSTSDKVYRDAARHFSKHKETLKESGKALADLPHRWFAKSEPVRLVNTLERSSFNIAEWETLARNLSARFLKHPSILNSAVMIQFTEGYQYLVSSEGTVARIPISEVSLGVIGQSKNDDGEFGMDRIIHLAKTPGQLPKEAALADEIDKMIVRIEAQTSIPKFTDEYTGPVLFMGGMVAELFSNTLLQGRGEGIFASDNIPKLKGYQYDQSSSSMEGKIGKNVVHESMTIKVKPKLKSFQGVDLLGSFDMDDEAIVPADELVVVENGVLKTLLNNRTLTNTTQIANGFGSGPGVIEVTIAQKNTDKVLKEKLLAQAKKEGLDYAIIVRDEPAFGMGLLNVYKVSVTDGKEELYRQAVIAKLNFKTLKHILGASDKYQALNISPEGNFNQGNHQGMTSYIVPQAVLVEEADVKSFNMPTLKEENYVSNPLK